MSSTPRRGLLRSGTLGLALVLAPLSASAKPDCTAETAVLQPIASGVRFSLKAPKTLTAGGAVEMSWRAAARAPLKTPLYIVISVPGEVRFEAARRPTPKKTPADSLSYAPPPPDLPGFIALSPSAKGPLGLAFGAGRSRALIPLHQPGAKLTGAFHIRIYDAGKKRIEAAVVARTACGERVLSGPFSGTVPVTPGQPEVVVQDRYDLETPKRIIVSNSGRYRAHIFEGRYKVYDVATGAKLVDRAGHDPNFSPTSRFIVANTGARGSGDYEVIDLAARTPIVTVQGSFIGWTHGDSFLIVGGASWGALSVRPTLISRPAGSGKPATEVGEPPDDGLALKHPGSCHACASWTDDSLMLDLDNGILAYGGTFDQNASTVYELASGATLCCYGDVKAQQAFIYRTYAVVPVKMQSGWRARAPIRFSQIYDPLADPNAKQVSDQAWFKGAFALRKQLLAHHVVAPKPQVVAMAAVPRDSVVRGDWRARVAGGATKGAHASVRSRLLAELTRFDLIALEPAAREKIGFINSWAGSERRGEYQGDEAKDKRIEKRIELRTRKLEARLGREIPTVKPFLGRSKDRAASSAPLTHIPYEGLAKSKIYLDDTLEGLWRWRLGGRPVWFLQLWATEGNGGVGEGCLFLLEGDKPGTARTGGRIVDLTKPLAAHWSGSYGPSDHHTQLKPQVYLDRYLVSASVAAKSIAVYDLEADKVVGILKNVPQADLIEDVVLTIDAKHVIQINSDGQFFIHELGSGRVALSGRVVDDEFIIYTPEGYYWSSYEGAHFVQLRFPGLRALYSFQQFAAVLDRPDIISAQVEPGAAAPPKPNLVPPPTLDVALARGAAKDGKLHLGVNASASTPLTHLRLYADGHLVEDLGVKGRELTRRISVPRPPNARWLIVQVTDSGGLVSKPEAVRLSPGAKRTNVLRAVVVGINSYGDPKLRLHYARSDAERLAAALRANAGHYYARSEAKALLDQRATKDAILSTLRQAVAAASADDTLVFSFAGHGVQDRDGRYYLTPADFDIARIAETGLAWEDVATVLQAAKARVIVILDSCHAALSGVESLGTNDDAVGALLTGVHAPMLVLAASKGRQLSYEGSKWGGGVFTHALIEAIQRHRSDYDLDHNSAIEASELYYALKSIVVRDTGGAQTPWLVRQDLLGDFAVF